MAIQKYEKILLDSNILVYSINASSPKNEQAQLFIENGLKEFMLLVADQNILESLRILTHPKFERPMPLKKAVNSLEILASSFIRIFPSVETKKIALDLIKEKELSANKIFDAYLAATMISNDVFKIATDNIKDFRIYKQIKVVDPFQ